MTEVKQKQIHTQSQALYSLYHILRRIYCLAIAQMTSAKKVYLPNILGIIIKWCHMIDINVGVNTSAKVTEE